jgi:hypothetical protein
MPANALSCSALPVGQRRSLSNSAALAMCAWVVQHEQSRVRGQSFEVGGDGDAPRDAHASRLVDEQLDGRVVLAAHNVEDVGDTVAFNQRDPDRRHPSASESTSTGGSIRNASTGRPAGPSGRHR